MEGLFSTKLKIYLFIYLIFFEEDLRKTYLSMLVLGLLENTCIRFKRSEINAKEYLDISLFIK